MLIRSFFLLFLVLTAASADAQDAAAVLTGKVTGTDRKPVRNVSCRLLDSRDSLIAYALTQRDGSYRLRLKDGGVRVSFSMIGYETAVVSLKPGTGIYNVTLERRAIELQEVKVTVDPIVRREDTLVYNVDAFRKKGDQYLSDVLRRMPGLEVDDKGGITYQGKSINKLNIEGLDLMGPQYNQATRNMPAEAVAQVEVMEDNQPVRVLEGKVHNDRATLNLKLKKNYKLRVFGEAEGGTGLGSTLWDNRLTAISIGRRQQMMLTGMMNNSGNDLSGLSEGMSTLADRLSQESLPASFLYSPTSSSPPVAKKFYLDNKSVYGGANLLHAFTRYSTLRLNMLYSHDRTFRSDSIYNRYVAADTVSIFENNRAAVTRDVARGMLTYELNSRNVYLSEKLTGSVTRDKASDNNSTNVGGVEERTSQKPWWLQNTLDMTFSTGAGLFELMSTARIYDNNERLADTWLTDGGTAAQALRLRNVFMRNRIGTVLSLKKGQLEVGYTMEYKHNDITLDGAAEHQTSSYWLHTVEPAYEYQHGGWRAEVSLPAGFITCRYSWREGTSTSKLMLSPSVDVDYKFSGMLKASLRAGYSHDADTDDALFSGVIDNDYRTSTMTADSLSFERTAHVSMLLSYMNAVSMFSWSLLADWMHSVSDLTDSWLYTGGQSVLVREWRNCSMTAWSVAARLKKVFRDEGLTAGFGVTCSRTESPMSQNSIYDRVRRNIVNMRLSLGWDRLKWLSLNITGAGNISWKAHDAFSASSSVLKNMYYTAGVDLYPVSSIQVHADVSQSVFEISHGRYSSNCFLNGSVKYSVLKSLALTLTARNLFNRRRYDVSSYKGANYRFFSTPLRGREVMLSANVKF